MNYCGRCQCKIMDGRLKNGGKASYITFANFENAAIETWICEKCSLGFIEWFAKGNYIQKQITKEENENV